MARDLCKVRQIHDNCRTLLRTNHQRAGLELMELMANYQEMAYDRLCRWVQGECRNIGEFDAPEVGGVLQAAVRTLAERPVLFKYCAEEVITARQTALFQRFITALTRGGPGGMPRPMELHAHDPQRYINDMLAWVHQTLAGEREFVVALFGDGAPSGSAAERSAGTRPGASSGGGSHEQARAHSGKDNGTFGTLDSLAAGEGLGAAALLDRIFESICRPLRVRIEQVLMTTPPLLLCYQLAQLHSFYLALVTPILGPGAQLVQTLAACRAMALRVFMEQIRARGDKLLLEAVHGMLEVVRAHESALGAGAAPPGIQGVAGTDAGKDGNVGGGEELGPILAAMLDPIVEACQLSAEALLPDAPSRVDPVNSSAQGAAGPWGALDPRARHVYFMNCLAHMATALGRHPCAAPRVQQLLGSVEGHVSALVGLEAGRLLSRCGLADVSARLRLYRQHSAGGQGSGGPGGDGVAGGVQGAAGGSLGAAGPASDPALAYPLVVNALRSFFVLVSSPDVLPEFRDIQPPRLRAEACTRVGQALAEAFESVYAALDDPTTGYAEQGGSASELATT
ncbi:component of oligomeric Golgi complex 6 [Haematococcus lacustris]|uniref:Component of oligomeric Golgi complex 6 n=1 Tax=Haematococcus lacustris TaxID=44745 RepID=A0A699ZRN4_HAELA|nr:component of oligomeric Golgi complex 6 [Haematococcus lacustris]